MNNKIELPSNIDPLILPVVQILNEHGFKTFESCQGGKGHCYPEPTVRFEGSEFDLIRAYEVCNLYKLQVYEAKRVYRKTPIYINEETPNISNIGEVWESPFNELTFLPFTFLLL
jgi:hypothetical protein